MPEFTAKKYQLNTARITKRLLPLLLVALFIIALCICMYKMPHSHYDDVPTMLVIPIFAIIIVFMLLHEYITLKYYLTHCDLCIQFNGSGLFNYGYLNDIVTYNTSDVTGVNIYGIWGRGVGSIMNIAEVSFANGGKIKVPGLLMDETKLIPALNNPKVTRFPLKKDFVPAICSFTDLPEWFVKLTWLAKR